MSLSTVYLEEMWLQGSISSDITHALLISLQLSPEVVEQLMTQLGVDVDDGVGVDYHSLLPHLAAAFTA